MAGSATVPAALRLSGSVASHSLNALQIRAFPWAFYVSCTQRRLAASPGHRLFSAPPRKKTSGAQHRVRGLDLGKKRAAMAHPPGKRGLRVVRKVSYGEPCLLPP